MYKRLIQDGQFKFVKEEASGIIIPLDENNRHYIAYLAWVDEGNTAEDENYPS